MKKYVTLMSGGLVVMFSGAVMFTFGFGMFRNELDLN